MALPRYRFGEIMGLSFGSRLAIAGLVTSLPVFLFTGVSLAADPDDVRQLLQTNACEGCDLSDAALSGLDLSEADLRRANLQGANLSYVTLTRANLQGANLQEAKLGNADLRGAMLREADLSNAQITNFCELGQNEFEMGLPDCVMLNLAKTLGEDLCTDDYGLAALTDPNSFIGDICQLEEGYSGLLAQGFGFSGFLSAILQRVELMGADLQGANLSNVNLSNADLRYAQLADANFSGANLDYALLFSANVEGAQNADLSRAFLSPETVGSTLQQLYADAADAELRQSGLKNTGSMNRAQQAYFLENSRFIQSIDNLGIGLEPENAYYRFEIAQATTTLAVNVAYAQTPDLKSYIGLVYARPQEDFPEGAETLAILCEVTDPLTSLPDVSNPYDSAQGELRCPVGSTPFEF